MHLDSVLCHSESENSVKMENSATCYLASEGITACRMTAMLLDDLGSVLSCGTHCSFVFFRNNYASYHACLKCVDYWVIWNVCIYSSLVLLSIVLFETRRGAVLDNRDMFCGSNAYCIILHTFAFIFHNLVKLVIEPFFIAGWWPAGSPSTRISCISNHCFTNCILSVRSVISFRACFSWWRLQIITPSTWPPTEIRSTFTAVTFIFSLWRHMHWWAMSMAV